MKNSNIDKRYGIDLKALIQKKGGQSYWNSLPKYIQDAFIKDEQEKQRKKSGHLRPEEYEWFKECRGIAETF